MIRRSGLLLSLVLDRRASADAFVPRVLTVEDHARLAAMGARGAWDRDAATRSADASWWREMAEKLDPNGAGEHGGPMPGDETWGGRG